MSGVLGSQSCLSLSALLLRIILFFLLTQFCFVYMLRPLWLTDILLWQHIIFGSQYNPCLDLFVFVLQGSAEWCSCLGSSLYSTTSIVCDFVKVRYLSTYLTVSSFQFSPFNILSRFLFYSGEVCRRKKKVILISKLSLLHVVDKLWNEENITNLSMDTTISWFVELEPAILVISKFYYGHDHLIISWLLPLPCSFF